MKNMLIGIIMTQVFMMGSSTHICAQYPMEKLRQTLATQPRRIIYNDDGTDAAKTFTSRDEFLQRRFLGLEETQVDSVFFCDGVFNMYSHRSDMGQPWPDWISRLHEQNEDPVQYVVDYCREHSLEIFWSMRMNDIHDSWATPLFGKWKDQHRHLLMAPDETIFPYGRAWTALDYSKPGVRATVLSILEEVCRNYEIDGIELDFNRHDIYFKPNMFGLPAKPEHLDILTDLMRNIRQLTETIGLERGRPLLIAIRTADSVEYCRETGIDIVRWLEQDLLDLWIVGGFFQLNPWEESINLGHRYNVPVYPCLSRTRIPRDNIQAWRGEAYRAWQAGADGIYTFNMYNPKYQMYNEIHDIELLKTLPRQDRYDLDVKFHHINSTVKANVRAAITFLRDAEKRFLSHEVLWRIYPFLYEGKRLMVPRDYPDLRTAIQAAQPHDQIWVAHNHQETVDRFILDKAVDFYSCDSKYTTLQTGAECRIGTLQINRQGIQFHGFEFTNNSSDGEPLLQINQAADFSNCRFTQKTAPHTALLSFAVKNETQASLFENCVLHYRGQGPVIQSQTDNRKPQSSKFVNCLLQLDSLEKPAIDGGSAGWWDFLHCSIIAAAVDAPLATGQRGAMLRFANCILHAPHENSVAFDARKTWISSRHNLLNCSSPYQGYVHDKSNDILYTDPGFGKSVSLLPNSPAIDKGQRLWDPFVPCDIQGTVRDIRPDMGCCEYIP